MPSNFSEVIVSCVGQHVAFVARPRARPLRSNDVKTNRVILLTAQNKLDAGSRRPFLRSVEYVAGFPNDMRQRDESA